MVSMAAHHAEWMSLVDVSGPFLSVPVLNDALPNGLDAHDSHVSAELRAALEEWSDPEQGDFSSVDSVELHTAFVRFILSEVLGFEDDVLVWDHEVTATYVAEAKPHGVELVPDAVVLNRGQLRMLVSVVGPTIRADEPLPNEPWIASPQERMVEHLKAIDCRLGLVTDGERWTLVSYDEGQSPGFATWWSSLWSEDRITLQAFRTLLGQYRFVSVPEDETLAGLLDRSAEDQSEITTKLGNQTLKAVEILIRTIDQIDRDRGGQLLADVDEAELYDAAVTVMMRLIFLFYAEANDLLPTSEPLYIDQYAASTLRNRLQETADQFGEEVLESTYDGWARLLAIWRAVYGGVEHADMVVAPYGGSLFDPDRYPFLEGRLPDTLWADAAADPLPIDNRTVLHLLNSLQTLDEGGQRRKLSFRALDVEQIGHVYEGMLDHTAARAKGWVLGLSGSGGKEPEIELDELEAFDDDKALLNFLKDKTGRGIATNKKWMTSDEADRAIDRFGTTWAAAFGGDTEVAERLSVFAKLIRPDSTGAPTAFQPGSVYVAASSHRSATGTHYTPRSLTEEIVKHTLEPLVYIGPSDGMPEDEWELRTAEEILELKICDPACGSGAFLVQACRYLADAVVEASRAHGERSDAVTEDEIIEARRLVAERCLHGVDLNPMAIEMAKLSLWLLTVARDFPFTFIDHAFRCGDSLVGLHSIDQLLVFDVEVERGERRSEEQLFSVPHELQEAIADARDLLGQILCTPSADIAATMRKGALLNRIYQQTDWIRSAADHLVALRVDAAKDTDYEGALDALRGRISHRETLPTVAQTYLHWPLDFPLLGEAGFDAVVSNPPFMGGGQITTTFGKSYRRYLSDVVGRGRSGRRGRADLAAYFLRRCTDLARYVGLVTTNSITEGDTREAGLSGALEDGWQIYRAVRTTSWPGEAAVEVSKLWLTLEATRPQRVLDGRCVEAIDSSLRDGHADIDRLERIPSQRYVLSKGSVLNGEGFIICAEEAERLLDEDPRSQAVVRPFLIGRDLTESPEQRATRYVICFWDMSESEARMFESPFRVVEERVKPERVKKGSGAWRAADFERYWRFHTLVPGIYESSEHEPWVIALPYTAKHVVPVRVSGGQVYSEAVLVHPHADWSLYGLLLSSIHREWAHLTCSTIRSAGVRYTSSACFETLPLPMTKSKVIPEVASRFDAARALLMENRSIALTEMNNLLANPSVLDGDVAELRAMQRELDRAVAEAYGWSPDDLTHGFIPGQMARYSLAADSWRLLASALVDRNVQLAGHQ